MNHTVAPGARNDYVNPSAANPATFDLHLKSNAKAIDRGDPTSFASSDIDGHVRPAGGAPDAGADEFGAGPPGTGSPQPSAPPSGGQAGGDVRNLVANVRLTRKRVCNGPAKRCRTRVVVVLARPAAVVVKVRRAGKPHRRPAIVRRFRGEAGRNSVVLRGRKLRPGRYRVQVRVDRLAWPVRPVLRVR